MTDTRRRRLRELLADPNIAVVPGCVDAIGARLIHTEGFQAAYITGMGVAATLGRPDHLGLVTMTEVVDRAKVIANSVCIPVICDADTGDRQCGERVSRHQRIRSGRHRRHPSRRLRLPETVVLTARGNPEG